MIYTFQRLWIYRSYGDNSNFANFRFTSDCLSYVEKNKIKEGKMPIVELLASYTAGVVVKYLIKQVEKYRERKAKETTTVLKERQCFIWRPPLI